MTPIRNTPTLQQAYQELISRYANDIEYAITLTLKQATWIHTDNSPYASTKMLNEEALKSTIRYFTCNLTRSLFGNQAKHRNKQHYAKPLLLVSVEGLNSHKLVHLHMALGNVPEAKHQHINEIIKNAWYACDFANEQLCIKPIFDGQKWLDYITKEIGYENDDALDIMSSTIPSIFRTTSVT